MARKIKKKEARKKKIKGKEKIEESTGEKELEKNKAKKRENEFKWLIIVMVLSIVVFLVFFWLFKFASVSFKYEGMKFEKEAYSNLNFYHTQLSISRIDGKFIYDLYMRNDPRTLQKIPANFSFRFKYTSVVSFEPAVDDCPQAGLAGASIGNLFSGIGSKVYGATTNEEFSNLTGKPFITCNDSDKMTVVEIRESDSTYIEQNGDCYILHVKNCEILEVSEKFVLDSLVQIFKSSN
jgi:hypothetical protein